MSSFCVKAFQNNTMFGFLQVMDTETSETVHIYVPEASLPELGELMSRYSFKKGDPIHFHLEPMAKADWFAVDNQVNKIGYRSPWKMWFVATSGALTLPAELKESTGDKLKKYMNTLMKGDGLTAYYEEVIRGPRLSQEIQEIMGCV